MHVKQNYPKWLFPLDGFCPSTVNHAMNSELFHARSFPPNVMVFIGEKHEKNKFCLTTGFSAWAYVHASGSSGNGNGVLVGFHKGSFQRRRNGSRTAQRDS